MAVNPGSMGRSATRLGWAFVGLALAVLSCRSGGMLNSSREGLAPPPVSSPDRTETFVSANVDRQIREQWHLQGVVPAAPVDDARFLRRVCLDIIGRIPTLDEIQRFEADRSDNRRSNVVNALLASSGYADHWTNYWEDVLLLDKVDKKFVDRDEFRRFLHDQFERNVPWDQVVQALIAARGANRETPASVPAGGPAVATTYELPPR